MVQQVTGYRTCSVILDYKLARNRRTLGGYLSFCILRTTHSRTTVWIRARSRDDRNAANANKAALEPKSISRLSGTKALGHTYDTVVLAANRRLLAVATSHTNDPDRAAAQAKNAMKAVERDAQESEECTACGGVGLESTKAREHRQMAKEVIVTAHVGGAVTALHRAGLTAARTGHNVCGDSGEEKSGGEDSRKSSEHGVGTENYREESGRTKGGCKGGKVVEERGRVDWFKVGVGWRAL